MVLQEFGVLLPKANSEVEIPSLGLDGIFTHFPFLRMYRFFEFGFASIARDESPHSSIRSIVS